MKSLFPLLAIKSEKSLATTGDLVRRSREVSTKERQFIETRLNIPLTKFKDYHDFLQVGCKKVWATFRAMHLKASVLLTTSFAVRAEGSDDNILDNKDPKAQALAELLRMPNPYDTWEEMLYMWTFHIGLTGSAFWVKDQVDLNGVPTYLYPLLPQYVRIVPDAKKKVKKYIYHVNGQEKEYAPEEIIHFRRPHPTNIHWGIGEIEPSQPLFANFINRDQFEEKFIENGAMPSGLLTYRGVGGDEGPQSVMDLDDEEWGKIKDFWHQEYGGRDNAGKTILLTGEWDYKRLGLTHVEMESMEKEKHTIHEIFMNHGVPGSIAGYERAANYATSRQDEINFRRFEIVPLLDLFQGRANTPGVLVKPFNPNWNLRYNLSGLIDIKAVWQDYEGLVRNGGMTLNEVREKMGLQRVADPALDVYYTEQTRIPLDMAGLQISENDLGGLENDDTELDEA